MARPRIFTNAPTWRVSESKREWRASEFVIPSCLGISSFVIFPDFELVRNPGGEPSMVREFGPFGDLEGFEAAGLAFQEGDF